MGDDLDRWDEERLATLIAEALAPSRPIRRIEPKETWRTRNSAFFRFRAFPAQDGAQPFDLVFKSERRWTPELAQGTHAALRRLADLPTVAPGRSASIAFPEPLGWTSEPPGLIMAYVEGFHFFDSLTDSNHPLRNDPERLSELVRLCGEAFGWIHKLARIEPDTPDARQKALRRLPRGFRWIMLRWARPPAGSVVRSHNFSRNDFLVSPHGVLHVLDPPSKGKPALLHEDLAWFTYQLLGWLERSDEALRLRAVFLEGYASTRPDWGLSRDDRRAVIIYEAVRALGTAKRMLLKRRLRLAIGAIRIALGASARSLRPE